MKNLLSLFLVALMSSILLAAPTPILTLQIPTGGGSNPNGTLEVFPSARETIDLGGTLVINGTLTLSNTATIIGLPGATGSFTLNLTGSTTGSSIINLSGTSSVVTVLAPNTALTGSATLNGSPLLTSATSGILTLNGAITGTGSPTGTITTALANPNNPLGPAVYNASGNLVGPSSKWELDLNGVANFDSGNIFTSGTGTLTANSFIGNLTGAATSVPWSGVTGTPTTLFGYGITNGQVTLTLTTTGTSGAASLTGTGGLNIPQYSGLGTVTSVSETVPSFLSISGSPITSSGTLLISLSGTPLPLANGGTGSTNYLGQNLTWTGTNTFSGDLYGNNATFTNLTATGTISATIQQRNGSGAYGSILLPGEGYFDTTNLNYYQGNGSVNTLIGGTGVPSLSGTAGVGFVIATGTHTLSSTWVVSPPSSSSSSSTAVSLFSGSTTGTAGATGGTFAITGGGSTGAGSSSNFGGAILITGGSALNSSNPSFTTGGGITINGGNTGGAGNDGTISIGVSHTGTVTIGSSASPVSIKGTLIPQTSGDTAVTLSSTQTLINKSIASSQITGLGTGIPFALTSTPTGTGVFVLSDSPSITGMANINQIRLGAFSNLDGQSSGVVNMSYIRSDIYETYAGVAALSTVGGINKLVALDGTTTVLDFSSTTTAANSIKALNLITVQTGTLVGGTSTKTVPAGCHPWVQDNASSLTNVGSLTVTTSGTVATITSTNILDVSPYTLYNFGSQ